MAEIQNDVKIFENALDPIIRKYRRAYSVNLLMKVIKKFLTERETRAESVQIFN